MKKFISILMSVLIGTLLLAGSAQASDKKIELGGQGIASYKCLFTATAPNGEYAEACYSLNWDWEARDFTYLSFTAAYTCFLPSGATARCSGVNASARQYVYSDGWQPDTPYKCGVYVAGSDTIRCGAVTNNDYGVSSWSDVSHVGVCTDPWYGEGTGVTFDLAGNIESIGSVVTPHYEVCQEA